MATDYVKCLASFYRIVQEPGTALLLAHALQNAPDGPMAPVPDAKPTYGELEIVDEHERREVNGALTCILNLSSIRFAGIIPPGSDPDKACVIRGLVMTLGKLLLGEDWEPELYT
jgi:hypothetical protein